MDDNSTSLPEGVQHRDRVGWRRIHIEAERPEEGISAVHEDISQTHRLGESGKAEPPPRPHCGVDQPVPGPARHRGASPPRPRLGLVSALLEGRRPPSTKASPRHLAQGGRARSAPSTPSTTRLSSTPSRRAFRSGRRIGDAVERSLGSRLQTPRPESYKPASRTGLGPIPVRCRLGVHSAVHLAVRPPGRPLPFGTTGLSVPCKSRARPSVERTFEKYWPPLSMDTPQTNYVRVGEGDVAYQVFGDGPVDLLFSYGLVFM